MIEVEATHVTTKRNPPAWVCELYPGIFVVDRGGVHTVREAGNCFTPLPKRRLRQTFRVDATALRFADIYNRNLWAAEEFEAELAERRARRSSSRP